MSSAVNTQNFINEFKNMINIEKNYTRLELNNILKIAYDNVIEHKKNFTNKKPPTKYNLFVKEYLSILKDENPNLSRQDLMSLVGKKWKTMKDTYVPKENNLTENNETDNNDNNNDNNYNNDENNIKEKNNETENNNKENNKDEEVSLIPKKIENKKLKTVKKEKK